MATQENLLSMKKGHLLPISDWHKAPKIVEESAKMATNEGIPTGIGQCKNLGWYIEHGGQGPHISWTENFDGFDALKKQNDEIRSKIVHVETEEYTTEEALKIGTLYFLEDFKKQVVANKLMDHDGYGQLTKIQDGIVTVYNIEVRPSEFLEIKYPCGHLVTHVHWYSK